MIGMLKKTAVFIGAGLAALAMLSAFVFLYSYTGINRNVPEGATDKASEPFSIVNF